MIKQFVAVTLTVCLTPWASAQDEVWVDGVLSFNTASLNPFPFGGGAQVTSLLCVNYYRPAMGMMAASTLDFNYTVVESGMAGVLPDFELCNASTSTCAVVEVAIEGAMLADGVVDTAVYTGNSTLGSLCPSGLTTQDLVVSYPAMVPVDAGTYEGTFEIGVTRSGMGGMGGGPSADLQVTMVMPELVKLERLASGDVGVLDLLYNAVGPSDLVDEAHFCIYSNEIDATGLGITVEAGANAGAPVLTSATTGQNVPYAFILSTGPAGSGTQVFNVLADGSSSFGGSLAGTVASADFATSLDASANCVSQTHYLQVTVGATDAGAVRAAADYNDTITLTVTPD